MFVIELTYKADLAEIDAHMAAHVIFLKKYYAAGNFLVSGRKVPRDGGIILAKMAGSSWPSARIDGKSKPSSRKIHFSNTGLRTFGSSSSAPANERTTFRTGSRGTDQQTEQ